MKKHLLFTMRMIIFLLLTAMTLQGYDVKAQNDQPYISDNELPDAVFWLPAPPEPGSSQFLYDISMRWPT